MRSYCSLFERNGIVERLGLVWECFLGTCFCLFSLEIVPRDGLVKSKAFASNNLLLVSYGLFQNKPRVAFKTALISYVINYQYKLNYFIKLCINT